MDPRIVKQAQVLMGYSLDVRPGQRVLLQGAPATLPLLKECYRAALALGAYPKVLMQLPEIAALMLGSGSEDQIRYVHEIEKAAFATFDAYLNVMGGTNTRHMSGVPAQRLRLGNQAGAQLQEMFYQRMARGEISLAITLHPTEAFAQEAGMSLEEYESFVYRAGHIDDSDPAEYWRSVHRSQEAVCRFLETRHTLRIMAPGTDLTMSVAGRKWVNCSGRVNFPDGEVFTGPLEDSAEGTIRFSFPGIYNGREIEDICLAFERGRVVQATAAKGQDLLQQLLDTDPGARVVGEIAVGTNPGIDRFTRNMLFDEKIGGTVHLALGRALPESRGVNVSAIHWDMLCDMRNGGQIYADGKSIYQHGSFIDPLV